LMDLEGILGRGRRSGCTIGVGLPKDLASKARKELMKAHAKVEVVCEDDPASLVSALKDGDVDGAVRGTLSSAKVLAELKSSFRLESVMRTAILEGVSGKRFLLTPVGIDEGGDKMSRLALVEATHRYFREVGWDVDVGVLSKGRSEDGGRSEEVRASLEEGEWLVNALTSSGFRAQHFGILLEDAVHRVDLVVAPDGVTGNLMFRAMHFVGGGKAYGAPVVNLRRTFVDTSRAKAAYSDAILLAAGLVESRSS
jgi:putative methanogen marker protein 4